MLLGIKLGSGDYEVNRISSQKRKALGVRAKIRLKATAKLQFFRVHREAYFLADYRQTCDGRA